MDNKKLLAYLSTVALPDGWFLDPHLGSQSSFSTDKETGATIVNAFIFTYVDNGPPRAGKRDEP